MGHDVWFRRSIQAGLALAVSSLLGATAPGRQAPGFSLPGTDGSVNLATFKGRVVYLDFWASWCGPCRKSFPWMNELQDQYSAQGLSVVAINMDKTREPAVAFLVDYPPSFTVAFDRQGVVADAYGVRAMPSSYLINRDGRVQSVHWGFVEGSERTKMLSELEHLLARK